MPTIRIDDEVWKALQKLARPFEDTPNDVLRGLLELPTGGTRRSMPRGPLGCTPQAAYWRPLLKVIDEMGGSGNLHKVLERLGDRMKSVLKPVDFQRNATGVVRYHEAAMWARHAMTKEGLLRSDSPRGVWEIADKGRVWMRREKPEPTTGGILAARRSRH